MSRLARKVVALASVLLSLAAVPRLCACPEEERAAHACCTPPTGFYDADDGCCETSSAPALRAMAPQAPSLVVWAAAGPVSALSVAATPAVRLSQPAVPAPSPPLVLRI